MQIDYLCDHPALISELAELNFNEWGQHRHGDTLQARTARMRAACGKGAVPSVVVAIEGSQLLGGALASALVNRIVDEAAALGIAELYLYTDQAQSLYARLGWEVVEHTVDDEGLGITVMKRLIQKA